MIRWLCLLVTGAVVSGFAVLLITGEYANDGRVVLEVSQQHGLHEGDVFVAGSWLAAMLALLWLAVSGSRHDVP